MTQAFFPSQIQTVIREWIWLDSLVIIQYRIQQLEAASKISALPLYGAFGIGSTTGPINHVHGGGPV